MRFAIRGGRKLVISEVPLQRPPAKIDNTLLKALARAHRWRQRIEVGEYASITDWPRPKASINPMPADCCAQHFSLPLSSKQFSMGVITQT